MGTVNHFLLSGDINVCPHCRLIAHQGPPVIEPFKFPKNLQEGGRAQITCAVSSGDMPIYFGWKKDDSSIPSSLQVRPLLQSALKKFLVSLCPFATFKIPFKCFVLRVAVKSKCVI